MKVKQPTWLKTGGYVFKYDLGTPEGGVSGITHRAGTTWHGSMFTAIIDDLKNMLSDPLLSISDKNAIVNEINEMQSAYAKIRKAHPDLTKPEFDEAVKKYQNDIIKKYNFVNQKGVEHGYSLNRYDHILKDKTKQNTGDAAGADKSWANSAEGYFAGITQDRTLLGYDGDWDENGDDFKNWQTWLRQNNLETFKDADGAYKLRILANPPEDIPEENPEPKTPQKKTPSARYPQQTYNYDSGELDPIRYDPTADILTFGSVIDEIRNENHNIPVPISDPDRRYTKEEAFNEATNEAKQAASEAAATGRNLSNNVSDMAFGVGAALEAFEKSREYRTKLAASVADLKRYTRKLEKADLDYNSASETLTHNLNDIRFASADKYGIDLLNADNAKAHDAFRVLTKDWHAGNSGAKQANGVNTSYYNQAMNQMQYNNTLAGMQEVWDDWASNIENSLAWRLFAASVMNDPARTELSNMSNDERHNYLLNLWESDDPSSLKYKRMWNQENAAYEKNFDKNAALQFNMMSAANQKGSPYYIDNLPHVISKAILSLFNVGSNKYLSQSPAFAGKNPYKVKQGTKAARLIDYVNAAQKEQQNVRVEHNKSMKNDLDMLNKELERINKQQMALLKQIYS